MAKPLTYESARILMASLCARSEQSAKEIREKLTRRGLDRGTTERVISYLIDNRFVDDRRYARAYAHDKMAFQAWGRAKIRVGLIQKGIASSLIAEALEALDPGEYADACLRAARAKSRGLDLATREDVARLYRHLASRGFESDVISFTFRQLRDE